MILAVAALLAVAFTPPSLDTVAKRVQGPRTTWAQRLVDVTDPFVGAPYLLSPLGEGEGGSIDADPRFRVDAFDCTTFVETALALSMASSLDEGQHFLDQLRYRGAVTYTNRRHFPEAEWIPDMVAGGVLVDITRDVGGADVVIEHKHLDVSVWKRTHHKGLPPLPDDRIPVGDFALTVWPLDKALEHPERIPMGTVLHLVRVDFKSVPVRVSHQGLVVDVKGKRVLRHAADRMHHHVVDEPLDAFLRRMSKYAKWPVSGVHLTRFEPAADWQTRLAATAPSTSSP
jgi:hypothetical protein